MKNIILAIVFCTIGLVEMAAQKTTTTVTTTETTTTYNGTDSVVVTRTTTTTTVSEPAAPHTAPQAKKEITKEEMEQMVMALSQMADSVETIMNDVTGLSLQMISKYAKDLQTQAERAKESAKPTVDALFDVLDASLQQIRAYSDSVMTNKQKK